MRLYEIRTSLGTRRWQADDVEHAHEQHFDAFPDEKIETVTELPLVTLVYDNETGTVIAAEDCMIVVCTRDESDELAEGTMDLETWEPLSSYPVMRDARVPADSAFVEVNYSDGTSARWCVSNRTGDQVANMLGTPDTVTG